MAKPSSSKTPKPAKAPSTSPSVAPSWEDAPARHDFPAAEAYLSLLADPGQVAALSTSLAGAATVHRKAKDILRAARLPLLPVDDPSVAKDLRRVRDGVPLAPVLLVRGELGADRPLQIADGYHRVCASYHLSEDTDIPCRLVPLPAAPA